MPQMELSTGAAEPSDAASVQSLQALLASVPASQLHSALASVLAKVMFVARAIDVCPTVESDACHVWK